MGLAGPRKRTKISHDPNNTNWARSTSGFGHKIMSSQGWTPGSLLGARNAAHANHFTAASASHVRVTLKDDTLGLGARPKRDLIDGPTGLDAFQGLLGRLNGKTDAELEKEQRKRDDVKLAIYTARKWQAVRFVSGGLLVPEKNEALSKETQEDPGKQGSSPDGSAEGSQPEPEPEKERKSKKHKKSKESKESKESKKSKKSKKGDPDAKSDTDTSKSKHKESKKRKHRDGSDKSDDNKEVEEEKKAISKSSKSKDTEASGSQTSRSETPTTSRERIPMGRHVFRSRHIQQKKRALMDDKSLNEIFMIKS
ncbi:diacylglycerol O-acyltransferase 1 [Paecilomyces lecythidis]